MGRTAREVLAANIKKAMAASTDVKFQEDLEARSGVSQSTISRILLLQAATNVDVLDKLAQAFGMKAWELLVDDDETRAEVIRRFLGPKS